MFKEKLGTFVQTAGPVVIKIAATVVIAIAINVATSLIVTAISGKMNGATPVTVTSI